MSAISTVSSDVAIGADRPMTIVAGGTPIGIGDWRPAVPNWGCSGGAAMPKLLIKGVGGTAITGPTRGMVGTHLAWVVSQ